MLEINGHKLEFDLFELETAKKYEEGMQRVMKITDELSGVTLSETIVPQCDAVRDCFDGIFGKDTGVKVCGENYNLTKHLDAFEILVDEAIRQRRKYDDRGKKYIAQGKYRPRKRKR